MQKDIGPIASQMQKDIGPKESQMQKDNDPIMSQMQKDIDPIESQMQKDISPIEIFIYANLLLSDKLGLIDDRMNMYVTTECEWIVQSTN